MEKVQELLDIADPTTTAAIDDDNNTNNNSSDGSDPSVNTTNRRKAALADCIQQKLKGTSKCRIVVNLCVWHDKKLDLHFTNLKICVVIFCFFYADLVLQR